MNVHARVLGNVIYFMASLTTSPKDLNAVSEALKQKLDLVSGVETAVSRKEEYEEEFEQFRWMADEEVEDEPVRTP